MMTALIRGSCLCGLASFEADPVLNQYLYCFCSRCRKKSGSAHSANLFLERRYFRWLTGEGKIVTYKLPDAEGLTNCFCGTCGSRMPRVTDRGVSIPTGSLDDNPNVDPDQCIYWESRAQWLPSRDEMTKIEGSNE